MATYLLSLAGAILGSAAVVTSLLGMAETTFWNIFFLLFGVAMVFATLKTITLHVEVDRDGVEVHQLWREHWIPWETVTKIAVAPIYADSEHLNISYGKKRVSLAIGFLKDSKVLNKAIIEAATSVNKEVELSALTVNLYGQPPYGIFTDQKADS